MSKRRGFDPATNNYFIALVATVFVAGAVVVAKLVLAIVDSMR
jgi:hypothetical protein